MFIWTIGDAVGLAVLIVIVLAGFVVTAIGATRAALCKHMNYRENRSCNAICNNCGKNLGFIGSVRRHAQEEKP